MGWSAEKQREKRAEKASQEGRTLRSWKRLHPASTSSASSATNAVPPEDPAEGDGPADGVHITPEEAALLGNVLRNVRYCAAKAADAQANAAGQAQLEQALATTATVTAPADVRASVLRRLQHAHAHWQARKEFKRSMLPSLAVYERIAQHCAQQSRLPPWAPWNMLHNPVNDAKFPNMFPYVCDECVGEFVEHADELDRFVPCDRCMHFEQMVCDAGGMFPFSEPAIALPSYLMDRE